MNKKVRYIASLVFLFGVIGVIGMMAPSSFAQDDDEYGKKCNCVYPNDGIYGRRIGDDCFAQDCWIDLPLQ